MNQQQTPVSDPAPPTKETRMSVVIDAPTDLPPAQATEDEVAAAEAAGNEQCTACAGTGTSGRSRTVDCRICMGTGWGVIA